MRIVFTGLELPIVIEKDSVSVLEIHNHILFSKFCHSLSSLAGHQACEPFSVWDDEGKGIAPKSACLYVGDPFSLPWQERDLAGVLQQRFETMLFEDYVLREEVESLGRDIASRVALLGFSLSADYSFGLEWDLRRYLKTFDYDVDRENASLFDSLMMFIKFAADMRFNRVLVFVNLKTFLAENQLELLYKQAVFSGIRMLLLENAEDGRCFALEKKRIVDQHFLES